MSPEQAPRLGQPLGPNEAVELQREQMPSEVFEAFNSQIAERLSNGRAVVFQDDVVRLMENAGLNRGDIFAKHWLDVEEVYRESGWKVEYSKPGYNESGRAYFTFTDPSKHGGRHSMS